MEAIAKQEALRFVTDIPPTHYAVRLEGFSLLAKNNVERYSTAEFQAGKYKWKLIIYPNGNKSRNGNENISVYITIAEGSFTHLCKEVQAVFRVSILDQNKDKYYTLQVSNGRHFNKTKVEWGFDQFMPSKKFNDPFNGYLVDDTCVFGADVYVKENHICKGERMVMLKNVNSYKHTWEIKRFSTIVTKDVHDSTSIYTGNHKWKIMLYPKGCVTGKDSHISIFLSLADRTSLPNTTRVYAEYTIRIIDQLNANNHSYKGNKWFSTSHPDYASGWYKFVLLDDFNASSNGYLVKDKCIVEAEVNVHGVTTAL